jgi:hypothetical protein
MDFEKKYKTLKKKIKTDFNYWLDNYIMIDISEAGQVDYLITDIDEYYFCQELESELTFCINNLIEKNKRELLIKFTELKRINNKRIISNSFYNEDDINEIYGITNSSSKTIHPFICLHSRIKDSESLLRKLYDNLIQKGFLECNEGTFTSLFKKTESITKVVWYGRLIDILGLINYFKINKIISGDNLSNPKIAFNYFKTPSEDFKLRSLEVKNSYINQSDNISKYQLIIDIIEKLD